MNKKIGIIASLSGIAMMAITVISIKNPLAKLSLNASGCVHEGYHYAAVAPTETESGNKEFWVCCKCHEVFLEEPTGGAFTTRPASEMQGGLTKEHPAYLSPTIGGESGDYYIVDPFDEE